MVRQAGSRRSSITESGLRGDRAAVGQFGQGLPAPRNAPIRPDGARPARAASISGWLSRRWVDLADQQDVANPGAIRVAKSTSGSEL